MVYDITNYESFEDIKKIWFNELKEHHEKYTILALVGNKCDLYKNEKVDDSIAIDYAKTINALFFLTSAKNGDNIDRLFENLLRKHLKFGFNSLEEGRDNNISLKKKKNNKNKKSLCLIF